MADIGKKASFGPGKTRVPMPGGKEKSLPLFATCFQTFASDFLQSLVKHCCTAVMVPRPIRDPKRLLAIMRERREELDVSLERLDELAGLPARYSAKLLAPKPIKNLGPMSFAALLGGLALGIVEITIIEDVEQAAKIGHRWSKRRRRPPSPWCVASGDNEVQQRQQVFNFVQGDEEPVDVEKQARGDAG